MMTEVRNANKTDRIIEVAQSLFGLYGLEKVSMLEIANELNISKASLYYYFPDKESLYLAVLEKEQAEFISRISEIIRTIKKPEEMLREYVILRLDYFSRLMNLSRLRLEAYSEFKPVIRETIRSFREKEKKEIVKILNKGIRLRVFSIEDPDMTASLFLDLLKGLRVSLLRDRRTLVIERDEYESLLEKTTAFTGIFIKGLRNK